MTIQEEYYAVWVQYEGKCKLYREGSIEYEAFNQGKHEAIKHFKWYSKEIERLKRINRDQRKENDELRLANAKLNNEILKL